ncbi:hypothetical protein K457DRAFT_333234 [Linnemannia elongata AG-77]|uniref:Uncharacterized protein n=1 Tax=Linnemannia elongata AG-77 TaxID=1314771 RepID=A0A197JB96_9FUNG|nr:hypothetical protein K457DRAFT_333234 [Linnemannia elongata AG-77]
MFLLLLQSSLLIVDGREPIGTAGCRCGNVSSGFINRLLRDRVIRGDRLCKDPSSLELFKHSRINLYLFFFFIPFLFLSYSFLIPFSFLSFSLLGLAVNVPCNGCAAHRCFVSYFGWA